MVTWSRQMRLMQNLRRTKLRLFLGRLGSYKKQLIKHRVMLNIILLLGMKYGILGTQNRKIMLVLV